MTKKMLVVEDEKIDVLRISQALSQDFPDVELEVVGNGEQALDWVHRFNPAENQRPLLIFMDLTIPRMSGLDLISEFKKNAHLRNAPIVILSAHDSQRAIQSAYSSGASGYVVKPDSSAEMQKVVKKTLEYWLTANRLPEP